MPRRDTITDSSDYEDSQDSQGSTRSGAVTLRNRKVRTRAQVAKEVQDDGPTALLPDDIAFVRPDRENTFNHPQAHKMRPKFRRLHAVY